MNQRPSKLWALLFLSLLLPRASGAGEIHPLITLQSSGAGGAHGYHLFDQSITVLRDGTVTASVVGNYAIGSPLPRGWLAFSGTKKGSAADFATLTAALIANRAGQLSGTCTPHNCQPWTDSVHVAWYAGGITSRKSSFVLDLSVTQY